MLLGERGDRGELRAYSPQQLVNMGSSAAALLTAPPRRAWDYWSWRCSSWIRTALKARATVLVRARDEAGGKVFTAAVRIDTPEELVAYANGGILPTSPRQLVRKSAKRKTADSSTTVGHLCAPSVHQYIVVLDQATGAGAGFDLRYRSAASSPELAALLDRAASLRGYAGDDVATPHTAPTRAATSAAFAHRAIRHRQWQYLLHGIGTTGGTTSRSRAGAYAAWGEDYHLVISERLSSFVARSCATRTVTLARRSSRWRPVAQEQYARHAGLADRQERLVISPELGSSHRARQPAAGERRACTDHCGTRLPGLIAGPTGAIVDPHVVDATRCISA